MSVIAVPIRTKTKPADIRKLFEQHRLRQGDKLEIDLEQHASALLLLVVVIIALGMHFNRKRETDKLLQDVFSKYPSIGELEAEVKREYGVELQLTSIAADEHRDEWGHAGMRQLGDALEDEDDISHMIVKEPNPKFRAE